MSFSYLMFTLMFFNMIASYEYATKIAKSFVTKGEFDGADLFVFILTMFTWNVIMSFYFKVEWV